MPITYPDRVLSVHQWQEPGRPSRDAEVRLRLVNHHARWYAEVGSSRGNPEVAAPAFRLRLTLVQGVGRARIRRVLSDSSSRFVPYGPAGELILGSRVVPGDGFRETIP